VSKRIGRGALLLVGWLQVLQLFAQGSGLPVEYYSVNDGLSDRMVTDIVQSEDGLLWLSTPNGLNRFDGYGFVAFDNHPDNANQISDANIQKLLPTHDGKFAIVYRRTFMVFDLFDPLTHSRKVVQLLPETGIAGIPRAIVVNAAGDIFALALDNQSTNLYQYDGQGHFDLVFAVEEENQQTSANIRLLALIDGSFLIQNGEKGVRHFSSEGYLLKQIGPEDFIGLEELDAYPGAYRIFYEDQKGKVWIAMRGQPGMYHYYPKQRRLVFAESLPRWEYYTTIWEDELGNILLGNAYRPGEVYPLKKLLAIRPDGRQHDFSHLLQESRFIVSAHSSDFFKNFILGIDTGLKIVQNRQSRVTTYLAESDIGVDQRGAVMRGVVGDCMGNVYMAREVDHWYRLRLDSNILDTLELIDEATRQPVQLSCGRSLEIDEEGYIWGVSCLDGNTGRLHRFDPETSLVRTYTFPHPFSALGIGRDGMLWLCAEPTTAKGMLVRFDPESERFTTFRDKEGNNPLRDASPRFVLQAQNGIVWIGSEDGLYGIDPEERTVDVLRAKRGVVNGLASNVIYVIHEDHNGLLWLGGTNGFNIFNPVTEQFKHYDRKDGLVSNTVCGFLPDEKGNYWISTFNGLSYFDRENETFNNFFRKEGLSHDEFNRFSYYRDFLGNFYLGGVNGMNVFRNEDLLVDDEPPRPILTKFSRYNTRLDSTLEQVTQLNEAEEIVILPSDSYFTFHFTIPAYTSPRRNQFKTKLAGYDKKWTYQGNNASLRLNNLPIGSYELLVKGADANGNWSRDMLRVPIVVEPAFYQTYWFIALCILLATYVLYRIFQFRLREKVKMERIRTKLSSDLHDEVSGLLAGIAMQTDMLQESVKDDASLKRIKQMGEVSRKAMSKMSDVIWSIDSRKDRMDDLIIRMREHAEEILAPLEITYQLDVNSIDLKRKIPVQLRQNLYFIFKEAINNIAKHSQATEVRIQLYNKGNEFQMTVADNGGTASGRSNTDEYNYRGNGRPAASAPPKRGRKKTGQGLSNLRMRAARIDAQIDIKPGEEGYTVQLRRRRFA
jgi:streptogramin lyase/two-component sensor histidine kinase